MATRSVTTQDIFDTRGPLREGISPDINLLERKRLEIYHMGWNDAKKDTEQRIWDLVGKGLQND